MTESGSISANAARYFSVSKTHRENISCVCVKIVLNFASSMTVSLISLLNHMVRENLYFSVNMRSGIVN